MSRTAINFAEKLSLFAEQWTPKVIAEMYVVPKGIEHKPYAEEEVKILLIEPRGVLNTGDDVGDRTAENDVWI